MNDKAINKINNILINCANKFNLEILSTVLFGARSRGEISTSNDYEILVLLENGVSLSEFILFDENLKLELLKEKLFNVKIKINTREIFEDILYKDKLAGTFLYMICKENVILYDRFGYFTMICERLKSNQQKSEEKFITQCIDFAKIFGSEKWEQKWGKALMQYRYLKGRNNSEQKIRRV